MESNSKQTPRRLGAIPPEKVPQQNPNNTVVPENAGTANNVKKNANANAEKMPEQYLSVEEVKVAINTLPPNANIKDLAKIIVGTNKLIENAAKNVKTGKTGNTGNTANAVPGMEETADNIEIEEEVSEISESNNNLGPTPPKNNTKRIKENNLGPTPNNKLELGGGARRRTKKHRQQKSKKNKKSKKSSKGKRRQ
jgi:hypothetical protein